MTAKTDPRSGIQYGWALGEQNWNTGMDANLARIGRFAFHLSVKDRDLTAPPASPSNGDTYIVAAAATGAWAGKDGAVAVWDAQATTPAWVFGTPRIGWIAYIEDEEKLSAYKAAGWSAGVAL